MHFFFSFLSEISSSLFFYKLNKAMTDKITIHVRFHTLKTPSVNIEMRVLYINK